ncbi:hypothetical protein FRC02_001559 [Tulasnella sp. 418]|nr:hypothetical protein FRC02_001559 [Tulasnella sp. 418]
MSTANQAINNPEKPTAAPNVASGGHKQEDVHDKAQSRPDIAGDSEKDHQGAPDSDYPPQLHAGKVGYGPHYAETHGKVSMGEKLSGIELELKGKITHNPELVQKGRDKFTGEAKRREMDEDSGKKVFKNADGDEGQKKDQTEGHDKPEDDKDTKDTKSS